MKTSETTSKLYASLVESQKKFPKLMKDADNPFYNSKYIELCKILDAVVPVLGENGLGIIQSAGEIVFAETKSETKSETKNETKSGTIACLRITTRIYHVSGEFIEETATIPLAKIDPQGFGSAVTYGKRYQLVAMLGIAADEDDDGNKSCGLKGNVKPETTAPCSTSEKNVPAQKIDASDIVGKVLEVVPHKYNSGKEKTDYKIEQGDGTTETVSVWDSPSVDAGAYVQVKGIKVGEFKGSKQLTAKTIEVIPEIQF